VLRRRAALSLILVLTAAATARAEGPGDSTRGDAIVELGRYEGPAFAELLEVRAWGDRVVFCSGVQGLNVYDASDPTAMTRLDRTGFSRGNKIMPRCQHVVVDEAGERLYVSHHGDILQRRAFLAVVDASNPRRLAEIGMLERDESVEGLAIAGDLLLVAAHGAGLLVFRRGEGGELTELGRLDGLGNAWSVAARGELAYVTDNRGGLVVVDLSQPGAPRAGARLDLPGSPRDVELAGERAFVALGSAGIAAVSLADPRAPVLDGVLDTAGTAVDLAVDGDQLLVADWTAVRAVDVGGGPMRPVAREPLAGEPGLDIRTLGIAVAGDTAFSAGWRGLIAYRLHPGKTAPDLVSSPPDVHLAAAVEDGPIEGYATLTNEGQEPLILQGFRAAPALMVDPLPDRLAPGESTALRIELAGGQRRAFTGSVTLLSDDPDQPELTLRIRAGGAGHGVGDAFPDVAFLDRSGSPVRPVQDGDGPVLLAYFATF